MDAVILFSHGSLLCGAGEALKAHAARLRARGTAPIVEVGYLNYSKPLFPMVVKSCVRQGTHRIVVVPYFLVPGKFVKVDLPEQVEQAKAAYPHIAFVVAEAIGYDEVLAEALIESAYAAAPPEYWRDDLKQAAAHCQSNPQCPLYAMSDCPHSPTQPASPLTPLLTKERGTSEGAAEASALSPLSGASAAALDAPLAKRRSPDREAKQSEGSSDPTNAPLSFRRGVGGEENALLVLVHGSPRPIANEEMFRVVEVARQRGVFPIVEVGFLECNEPSIPEAIDRCVAQGATAITAVPYFLHTGTHVADDLPTLLEAGRERHPNVTFRLGAYLGRSERVTDILAARIRAARKS